MTLSFQLSDKFTVNPSLRYSTLERLNGGNDYFDGSIARMNLRYQFSPAFNVRLIAEKKTVLPTSFYPTTDSVEPQSVYHFLFGRKPKYG